MKIPTHHRPLVVLSAIRLVGIARATLAADCSVTAVGYTPLNDLGTLSYLGSQGGLYPGGANARPRTHDSDLARVGQPVPLNAAGVPDPVNGKIGFISCGMSNCTQEFSAFKLIADAYPDKNPKVVIVDCAFPGKTAAIIMNPNDPYWANCDSRVAAAGLSNAQVQTVWLKEADANPVSQWPTYAQTLGDEMGTIVQILKTRYPNTRSTYLSSRIYAGYASSTLNPEPYAYESGFSVKWLVEAQLAGDPRYNFDPARGPVTAPWIAWGPYLWSDGLTARRDGLSWDCSDLANDGTHPSASGQAKVASLLLNFYRSNPTTIPWFLACAGAAPGEAQDLKLVKQLAGTELSWTSLDPSAGAATVYDILGGPLASLRTDRGLGGGSCLVADVPDTPATVANGGPVMLLKLDEGVGTVATDTSGYNNNGQLSNATWTAGRMAFGLQFNGADSIVTVPSTPSLVPLSGLTVAVWALPDVYTDGVLAAKWISGTDQSWLFRVRPDGTLRVNIVPTLTDNTYNNAGGTAVPVITLGAWQHVAFVYDGTQPTDATKLKIYVNGVPQALSFATGAIPATLTSGLAPLSIGLGADGLRPYSGTLDDVRIYPRALTDAEIQALFTGTAAGRSVWYRVRGRNSCAAGSWGDAELDGGAVACP